MHLMSAMTAWALPYEPADEDELIPPVDDEDRGSTTAASRSRRTGGDGAAARVRLLGGFQVVSADAARIEPSGVPGEVLKLVAIRGSVHVETVIGHVWADVDATTGRRRLRNVLTRIRSTCGGLVEREGDMLTLSPDVYVDAHRFEADAQRALALGSDSEEGVALASAAVAAYHGELLPGDRFRDWSLGPRERLQRRFVALLDLLAEAAAARGDVDEALWLIERGIEHEPYDEERYLAAARMLLDAGRRGVAAVMLRRADAMLDDLGVTPSLRLRELEQELRGG